MKELQTNDNRDAVVIAHEINLIKEQTNKILLQSSIEIGKRLSEAKEMVGHGNWSNWLETEVNYSQRTAQNLMKIYEEYGRGALENSNSQALADLGYTQAIAMLKLEEDERENFISENDVEAMSTRELNEAIREKNDLIKEKEELEKQLTDMTDKESSSAKELKARLKDIAEYEKKIREATAEKKKLKDQVTKLEEAAKKEPKKSKESEDAVDPKEVEKLNKLIKAKDEEVELLKKQLKEKPKEVEVEVEVEVVPAAIEEELNKLKSKLQVSDGAVKFKATFEIIMNLFNELIELVDSMKESNPDEHEKYKGAVNKLLDQLKVE